MSFNFYYFKDLIHKQQPYQSNWCWAACLSSLIDGLNTSYQIGNKQCNLASYYREYSRNPQAKVQVYNNCCSNLHNTSSECNKGIHDNHISEVYNHSGIIAREDNAKNIYNYNWVKQTLINQQAPILIKYSSGGQDHASLITGFGEIDDCKYYLLSNPEYRRADTYIRTDIIANYSISKIWVLEKLSQNKPEKDKEIYVRFEDAIRYVEELKLNKSFIDDVLLDPRNYLGHKHPAMINRILKDNNKRLDNQFINNLAADFRKQNQFEDCQRKITKTPEDSANIIGLSLDDVINPTDETMSLLTDNNFDCRIFIEEYTIELEVFVDNSAYEEFLFRARQAAYNSGQIGTSASFNDGPSEESIRVLPISYPQNYNLNKEPHPVNIFRQNLRTLPKARYFEEEHSSPAPVSF